MDKASSTNKGEEGLHQARKEVEVIEVKDKDEGMEAIISATRLVEQELRGLREKIAGWRRESVVEMWELRKEIANMEVVAARAILEIRNSTSEGEEAEKVGKEDENKESEKGSDEDSGEESKEDKNRDGDKDDKNGDEEDESNCYGLTP